VALDLTPQVSDVEITRASRDSQPNPIAGILAKSWDMREAGSPVGKSLKFDVGNRDDAEEVTRLLRRDSRESEYGVSIRYLNGRGQRVPNVEKTSKDGQTTVKVPDLGKAKSVHFAATEKRGRNYTVADVREWLAATGQDVPEGRLPKDVTAAYRAAHGLSTGDNDSTAGDDTGQSPE
jgi:hypothetical protein